MRRFPTLYRKDEADELDTNYLQEKTLIETVFMKPIPESLPYGIKIFTDGVNPVVE